MESTIYMCGMQAVGEGSPSHDIFKVDLDLSCVNPVEADIYASKRSLIASKSFVRDLTFCAICAGTSHDSEGGKVDVVNRGQKVTFEPEVRFLYDRRGPHGCSPGVLRSRGTVFLYDRRGPHRCSPVPPCSPPVPRAPPRLLRDCRGAFAISI